MIKHQFQAIGAVEALTDYVASITFYQLTPADIKEVKRRVLDIVGIGLSASSTETATSILKCIRRQNSNGQAVVWGAAEKTSPSLATLAVGTAIYYLELDDVHRTSHTHPGVTLIPPALALVDEFGKIGSKVINDIIVGYNVQVRIGMGGCPSIYVDRPFLVPAMLGTFGAAAVTAKLLELDSQETLSALKTYFLAPLSG